MKEEHGSEHEFVCLRLKAPTSPSKEWALVVDDNESDAARLIRPGLKPLLEYIEIGKREYNIGREEVISLVLASGPMVNDMHMIHQCAYLNGCTCRLGHTTSHLKIPFLLKSKTKAWPTKYQYIFLYLRYVPYHGSATKSFKSRFSTAA